MASIAQVLMRQVLARLRADPPVIEDVGRIRREHRTTLRREDTPAVYVADGDNLPDDPPKNEDHCPIGRAQQFIVSIFVRDDKASEIADPILLAIFARLDPLATGMSAYSNNARLRPGPIRLESQIADGDALRIDVEFTFSYGAQQWALDVGES